MTPKSSPSLKWTPSTPLLIFTALFFPVLIALGVWQLDRADEKQQMETLLNERQSNAPVAINGRALIDPYTRIIAEGEFDNSRLWLVDNRQRGGRPGYEVVQPFILSSGPEVLVNRGWVVAPSTREELPVVNLVAGRQMLFGSVAVVSDHPMLSAQTDSDAWPKIITQIVPEQMIAGDHTVTEYYVRIDAASVGALRTEWQPINMSASKHTGYAVQWFAMALALFILSIFANTNIATWWRQRKTH
ncbi:SURF1 family protein [Gilvimarinus sp. SDUM040013]|uniref:SURF1-like protein n=1 Tax=Gilvimarinus gilvus TaxID=3058038 RepID=A0ABU4S0R2_9GAMM|nr:SURF1 family protein [Gilvimarinus sp. SDUM040013]MDO3387745.1 SURF1 family protein [Gilvimarinus sp. SDUM040013]MDX6848814.1 SURF1 family protein [Gilvimarinus sp. SDUM040013]